MFKSIIWCHGEEFYETVQSLIISLLILELNKDCIALAFFDILDDINGR